jgi:hypothetical protein
VAIILEYELTVPLEGRTDAKGNHSGASDARSSMGSVNRKTAP